MKKDADISRKINNIKNIKKGTTPTTGKDVYLDAMHVLTKNVKYVKRPRRVGLPWSDEKKELLKEMWFHYKIKDLSIIDMEKIFCCNIQTISAYAKHLNLKCDFSDNKIDYEHLANLGIKTI